MARKTTFEEIIQQVRAEARISTAVSTGQANENYLKQLIKRYYEQLYDDYDWAFKRLPKSEGRITTAAGQRYYDFPATLDLERITGFYIRQGTQWLPCKKGIGPAQYNIHDSDANNRADPIMKWEIYSDTQFEVWPMPASDGGSIWIDGVKKKTPLIAPSDRCDLDDILVVLFVAAEILTGQGQKDASTKSTAAGKRLDQLKGKMAANVPDFSFSDEPDDIRRNMPRILVTANTTS